MQRCCNIIALYVYIGLIYLDGANNIKVQNQVEDVKERRSSKGLSQVSRSHKKHQKPRRKSQQTSTSIVPTSYSSLMELATPISSISNFCQAVLSKIIPNEFWGTGDIQSQNRKLFLKSVDHFIRLRRFETMSLHELMTGLKVIPMHTI